MQKARFFEVRLKRGVAALPFDRQRGLAAALLHPQSSKSQSGRSRIRKDGCKVVFDRFVAQIAGADPAGVTAQTLSGVKTIAAWSMFVYVVNCGEHE